ncbi:MAG: ABC transporter substrate-binding protein [Chloroflexi bacterium]|nr:ABC transporter substrate-binding protein [Chloroflexota bacterium]
MNNKRLFVLVVALVAFGMLAAQCPPPATPTAVPTKAAVEPTKAAAQPTTVPVEPTKEPAPPGKTSIVFWHTQSKANKALLDEMCADFTKETGIIVRAEYVDGYTKLYQKIMASIQAGNAPDMAVAYESMVTEYMKAGAVVELDPYINDPEIGLTKADFDDIWPGYIETNKFPEYGNKMLSFPFTKSMLVMYYNADMLKAVGFDGAPKTWDEFQKACAAVTKGDTIGYEIGIDASTIDGWIYSRGGVLLKDDLSGVRFNEQPGVDALQLIKDLVDAGTARQVAKAYGDQQTFGAGQCAFTMGSTTGRPFYQTEVGGPTVAEGADFEWGIAVIPQLTAEQKPVTVMYGANITVFKTTPEKQEACWKFIKWFTEKEQTAKWAITSGYMPVRKSAAETDVVKAQLEASPQYRQAFDILPYSMPEPNILGWQDTRTFLQDALTAVITGQKTPQAALDDAAKLADEAIQSKK